MKVIDRGGAGACVAALLFAGFSLSGCMSSPTYGTGKTQNEQLLDDLGDIGKLSSLTPKDKGVKYPPRPTLVMPPKGDQEQLAAPEKSLASKDDPRWLESPEESRKRLAAEAEENKNNPNYRSPLSFADSSRSRQAEAQQTAQYRAAKQDIEGTYDQRRYLIDPPNRYREVSDPAALNDLGTPEAKKERQRKKAAEAATQSKKSWWNPF